MNIDNIKRNSNSFSFIEKLESFVNNKRFATGFNEFYQQKNSQKAYIWSTLSTLAGDYGEIIYENVLNYINNVSNIDLCKIKALQSMIDIIGVKYNILDFFNEMPVEIGNLMDILSINKHYLLDSNVFKQEFINELSANGCIVQSTATNELSNELNPEILKTIKLDNIYINDDEYFKFLKQLYLNILNNYIYLQYADKENGLSTSGTYIYEYIKNQLLNTDNEYNYSMMSQYDSEISKLKLQYNISKYFDQSQIVDNIENSYDSISNYNTYEQIILEKEIEKRTQTYDNTISQNEYKPYLSSDESLGYNLTRYSYYRERKVKDYFKFIENTYNSLIAENNVIQSLNNDLEDSVVISTYEKDINYFRIDQDNKQYLLKKDSDTGELVIQSDYIIIVADMLAKYTLQIADIRDQIKIQIRKSYLRGTFLLVSYVVNEFLKYNILDKYGQYLDSSLSIILSKSINSGDNVKLIEYYDETEYFNISSDTPSIPKNFDKSNEKFWDNQYDKVGNITEDIPLDEIENFYLKQMKLENKDVNDLANFLSIIYEYGANNSYINRSTDEFTCQIHDGRFIGDPYNKISSINDDILSVQTIYDDSQTYINDGFLLSSTIIRNQIYDLSNWLSSYYFNKITSTNKDTIQSYKDEYSDKLTNLEEIQDSFNTISNSFEELIDNKKYLPYYQRSYFNFNNQYFIEKLNNFYLSVIGHNINWNTTSLTNDLYDKLSAYNQLRARYLSDFIQHEVWNDNDDPIHEYWKYYSYDYEAEITSQTQDLRTYLTEKESEAKDSAKQHIQSHYDKLLSYKSELGQVLDNCINAYAKLDSYYDTVNIAVGGTLAEDLISTYDLWGSPAYAITATFKEKEEGQYEVLTGYSSTIFWTRYEETYESYGVSKSDSIRDILNGIESRCNFATFAAASYRKTLILQTEIEGPDLDGSWDGTYGPCAWEKYHQETWTYTTKIWNGEKYEKDGPYPAEAEWYEPKYTTNSGTSLIKEIFAYDPTTIQRKWQDHYSESLQEEIIATFEKAITDLNSVVSLINSEIKCYGGTKIELDELTIDNVKEQSEYAFNELAGEDKILDSLDDYIKKPDGWKNLASKDHDENLLIFLNRLSRISAINSSNIKDEQYYNIRYFDTNFYSQYDSLQNLLKLCSDYFDEYTNNETLRLDKQIENISNYVIQRNANCLNEVISTCLDISSNYFDIINNEYNTFYTNVKREEINSVYDDYSYESNIIYYSDEIYKNISSFDDTPQNVKYKDYLDYLLSGNYIKDTHDEKLSGIIFWLSAAPDNLNESETAAVYQKIPELIQYKNTMYYINLMLTKYLTNYLSCEENFDTKLQYVIELYKDDILYISSQISVYDKNYEIYLKYNGTEIGYDPFYNYKNLTYSSYQIHPYLYNFVEKLNIEYPLANSFFVAFNEEYEKDLVKIGIDSIIGEYGNQINIWKNQLYDFTSYKSKYENESYQQERSLVNLNPMIGFTGAFYPPALKAYLEDTQKFIQDVEDDNDESYYKHLNLTTGQIEKIVKQLTEYEQPIREIANIGSGKGTLSSEYDIYKFAEDMYGNSLILFKSYKSLYNEHKNDIEYIPTYNEKKNTTGELWLRLKNHPLAFPAFDLRDGFEDISQYNIKENNNSFELNGWITYANQHFMNSSQLSSSTEDTIGKITSIKQSQNLRCFYDMELEPKLRSLLLVIPMYTGNNASKKQHNLSSLMSYANSSIIVGMFSYDEDSDVYSFSTDYNIEYGFNIDNIYNPGYIYVDDNGNKTTTCTTKTQKYDFIGFVKNTKYTYALFARKYINTNSFIYNKKIKKENPFLIISYSGYRTQTSLIKNSITSNQLNYDIFSSKNELESTIYSDENKYKYANNIVCTSNGSTITIGFITERIQDSKYENNSTIVNFAEYSSMCELKNDINEYGMNKSYPRETAMIQSDDASHINIYNSFDSFVQHLVNVKFNFIGNSIYYQNTSYFNFNSDLGFNPQYADKHGQTRYYNNVILSSLSSFKIELLGPENSDLPYTPIIVDTPDEEQNGRVTEDYRSIEKYSYNLNKQLSIESNNTYVSYIFQLSNIMSSEYDNNDDQTIFEKTFSTGEIRNYKYILFNNKYQSLPILKGDLSDLFPKQNTYQGSEYYDLISGDEIIGPNSTTYQNVSMSNHINNIKKINTEVSFDPIHSLPINITMSCIVNKTQNYTQVIDQNQFQLLLYVKNTYKTYEFFHIIQNPYKYLSGEMTQIDTYNIDFNKISGEISDYQLEDGRYPFRKTNESKNKNPDQLSANLTFKYSEGDSINREFPLVIANNIDDEIITLSTDSQYIYFSSFDNYSTVSTDIIKLKVYVPGDNGGTPIYRYKKIDYSLPKYRDFLDKALTIETTYNMEKIIDSKDCEDYHIVLYFNYKNYTNPQYIDILYGSDTYPVTAPSAVIYKSTDDGLKNTYLVLKPGESGKLDIRLDFVDYTKFLSTDITYNIAGKETVILQSYYIMNVSDSKPKFIIQKNPFTTDVLVNDEDNYEIDDTFNSTTFRYIRFVITANRGGKYISLSRIIFRKKSLETSWEEFFQYPSNSTVNVIGASTVEPNKPERLLNQKDPNSSEFIDKPIEYLGSNIDFDNNPIEIIIDLQSRCLDIDIYKYWGWANSHNSKSHSGNMPKFFELDFSNDMVRWWKADELIDSTTSLAIPTTNNEIVYYNKLEIKI